MGNEVEKRKSKKKTKYNKSTKSSGPILKFEVFADYRIDRQTKYFHNRYSFMR